MRVAAIQLQAAIGGADHNLEACCRMPPAANEAGAEVSVLPLFFNWGIAFDERLPVAERPPKQRPHRPATP